MPDRKISDMALLAQGSLTGSADYVPIVDPSEINADDRNKRIYANSLVMGSQFTQAGTGATARTVEGKLRDGVSVKDFGAVGDGVADDTAEIQAAIDTGAPVYFPPGNYKTTAGLTVTGNYQFLYGPGVLVPVGTFNAVTFTGGALGCSLDLTMDCTGQTGYAVSIDNANRTVIRRLLQISGSSGIYVQEANWTLIEQWYASGLRGSYGIRWYGTAALRSDILIVGSATCSFTAGNYGTGLDWDGNCNSLTILYLGVVSGGYGLRIRNSSGGPLPLIARIHDLEVDYPQYDAVRIEAGYDFDILSLYALGSATGSGVYVAAAVPADLVRIGGGKSTGNARYGIENLSRVRMGNVDLTSGANTLGEISGLSAFTAKRFEIGTNQYLGDDGSGNLLLTGNSDSYVACTNATGEWILYTGAAANFRVTHVTGTPYMGFYGATPVAKPTVTGSRGGNAALASLLTQLASLGLIVDSTS